MSVTVADVLKRSGELKVVSDTARLDAEVLLCHVLGRDRTFLYTWPEHRLDDDQQANFQRLFDRRLKGEPVAHLTGVREFWSLPLQVSPATLIPRPETELLVELSLGLSLDDQAKVLDLGTGTGAIALALASENPHWQITAVDASADAVQLAEQNRQQLGFDQVSVLHSDWFSALLEQRFDLILSNPPYISADDQHLQQGDVRFEPFSALVADGKGLADLQQIIDGAHSHLNTKGWLLLEHGCEQGEAVSRLMQQAGFSEVETYPDLAGLDRATMGRKA